MTHLYMPKVLPQKAGKAMLRDAQLSPKVAMEIAAPDASARPSNFNILHGEHIMLVDAQGRIRGYYRADAEGLARITHDARRLVRD